MYKFERYPTCVPQNISFSQDINLLNETREYLEGIIDDLCRRFDYYTPRMYRQNARKDYLNLAKCKKRTNKKIHKAIKQHKVMLVFIQNNNSEGIVCC